MADKEGEGRSFLAKQKRSWRRALYSFLSLLDGASSDDHKIYIHKLFGTSLPLDATSPKLRAVLMKIEETLILTTTLETVSFSTEDTAAFSSSIGDKVSRPKAFLYKWIILINRVD